MSNLLIIHGGGPTAVINESLAGAVRQAARHPEIGKIFGAVGGAGGLLRNNLIDLKELPDSQLELIRQTPGSAIGTSREHFEPADYDLLVAKMQQLDIRYVLMNGGNGTMEAASHIADRCQGKDIFVMGIPKTMDNDLAMTDHSPGFGSAARYLAGSAAEVIADVQSLPIHITVIEAMGRNAGWLTAAAALAADCGIGGPDLLYLPERAFDESRFLQDVQRLIDRQGCGVIVASEGLHDAAGNPIVKPVFEVGRSTYFGDVSAHLAGLITQKLGYKARSEKPGLLGRSSIPWRSELDCQEAAEAGAFAAACAIEGVSGKMAGLTRVSNTPCQTSQTLINLKDVMLHERTLPAEFINREGNGVTAAFLDWCRPLLGSPLPRLASLAGDSPLK